MAKLGYCHCCFHRVSSDANSCPACGQTHPYIPERWTEVPLGTQVEGVITDADPNFHTVYLRLDKGQLASLHVPHEPPHSYVVGRRVTVVSIGMIMHGRLLVTLP